MLKIGLSIPINCTFFSENSEDEEILLIYNCARGVKYYSVNVI